MVVRCLAASVVCVFLTGSLRAQSLPAVSRVAVQTFSQVTGMTALRDGVEVRDGGLILRMTALREDVIRVRAGRDGRLPEDSSWAVLPEARAASVAVTAESGAGMVGFHTASVRVRMERATGLLTVTDLAGRVLRQDTAPLQFDEAGFHLAEAMPADEHYFGLGDKAGAFDRREAAFRMWNTDAYAWQESTDPLYKAIPWYLEYRSGVTMGVLMDNTWPSSFDFGKGLTNTVQYRAEGDGLDMYLVYGPTAKQVMAGYAWLTGPTPLPPLWTLGFQQSRYSYPTQARLLEVAAKLRADKIPADAVYLDIDFQKEKRPFTVDTAAFPDFAGMVKTLHDEKMHLVVITDPHLAQVAGYAPYETGEAQDRFVKGADGKDFVGPVWPGASVFPDFTQQQTRAWWGGLFKEFSGLGVDGFWNDMNEPSVFIPIKTMPDTVVHRIDEPGFATRVATHREIHNVYGMETTRATEEGVTALRPEVRPFVLTRASYAGGQRYAATWTGDNSATWNHLRLTTPMLKNLGLSGFSMAGADVGGYAGTPSPELLTKWIEIAAFQPIDRIHSEKSTGDHEPWVDGPQMEAIRRRFIEERYKLLPYTYTVMEENTRTGLPLLRPLFLEFPEAAPDRHPLDIDVDVAGEFMVGPDLLVAPPPFPDKRDSYDVKLPTGGWFDYWTGERVGQERSQVVAGGLQPEVGAGPTLSSVRIKPEMGSLPVYVRPGAMLPMAPVTQNTTEVPTGPLTLRVFPGPDCRGSIYRDDGTSFAYRKGSFLREQFSCSVSPDGGRMTVRVGKRLGSYPAWWRQIAVEVHGLAGKPVHAGVKGKEAAGKLEGSAYTVLLDDDGSGAELVLQM